MVTDARLIEAALARAGWGAGAEALVAGWVDHRRHKVAWEETWEPDDRCRYISDRPTGERFVIEWVTGDTWECSISWPDGWGSEHMRMGFLEDLQDAARRIHCAEGPFGGPQAPALPMCALPGQRGKRLAGDVELRFERLREDLAAYFFITRQGSLNNLWIVHLDPAHLPVALDSLERMPRCKSSLWVQAQGQRRAWSFTAWRPLLARMQLGERELLLLCPDASTAVILAHAAGRLQAAVQIGIRELPDFDAGRWLASAPEWPGTSQDFGAVGPSPLPNTSPPPPTSSATKTEVQAAQLAEPSPPPGGSVVEAAPQPISSGPQRTTEVEPPEPPSKPPEQPKPRFPLAADASAEEFQRHFSDVEAAIPPRLTGTATAFELWQAIRAAHDHRALPITGNWVDLVAVLHHRGFLPHLPSDRASRAALAILAELSPLVRRLHHRRWVLGVER